MSYADNLYSADDLDGESFSNELSPTDGYFSNRDHPQSMMVPDPSLETGPNTADAKAREAREEAAASSESHAVGIPASSELPASPPLRAAAPTSSTNYSPSSPTAYTPRSPTSSHRHQEDLYSETSPLLHSTAPPPAYSAATSQPSLQHFSSNYSSISARQLESGTREPESMGSPNDFNERSPLWMKRVKRFPRWRLFRNILLITLVLGLAVGFIVSAIKSGESKKNRGDSSTDKSPSAGPEGAHGSYCPSASIHDSNALPTYEFELGKDLVILQVTGGENFRGGIARVRTVGEIILRRQTDGEVGSTGYITFDVWVSDKGISYRLDMTTEAQALKVVTPEFADLSSGGDHCLSIEITVWVPSDASFENILVDATSLSIRFMDDLDAHVSNESKIEAYSGDIYFPSKNLSAVETPKSPGKPPGFSSREISVATASGDITGTVLLYDMVNIETDSGDIDITVLPQPAKHDGDSSVAQLTLGAASGNIRCRFPVYNVTKIPDRNYRTSVRTHSGDIQGDYVIGTEAIFEVNSGDLEIIALPTTFQSSSFSTKMNSGSAHISVLEPLIRHRNSSPLPADNINMGADDPYLIQPPEILPIDSDASVAQSPAYERHLRRLTSSHSCTSGDQKIHYPNAWDGEITAVGITGNIKVGGDGVKTIKDSRKNWAYHEVVARKGPGAESASRLNVHAVSGNLDVWVGEGCHSSDWC